MKEKKGDSFSLCPWPVTLTHTALKASWFQPPLICCRRHFQILLLSHKKIGLSPPVKYFTDRSKAVLLLWIFYVFVLSCVCYVLCASVYMCFVVTCWGKGWPLGSRLWCLLWVCHFPNWYPGSGVVLDCIDSWSLQPYLLWYHALFFGELG